MPKKENKNNEDKNFEHAVISWYPGHMAKTKKQIIEDLKLIDVVVEILDARIPMASVNPDIRKYIQNKEKVVVLNKCDLADEIENTKWVKEFQKQHVPAVLVDSNSGKGVQDVIRQIEKVYEDKKKEYSNKGRVGKSIRVIVIGIPNVGKSSFINRITKKTSTNVGNKPGVTRQKQWVRVNEKIELLDTPGILWPKFENEEIALKLAYTGTIKDDILQKVDIAYSLLKYLIEKEQDKIIERYKIAKEEIAKELENMNRMENENILEIMYKIGRKRGAIVSRGQVDEEKTANIILEDFRSGKLGRITLEKTKE